MTLLSLDPPPPFLVVAHVFGRQPVDAPHERAGGAVRHAHQARARLGLVVDQWHLADDPAEVGLLLLHTFYELDDRSRLEVVDVCGGHVGASTRRVLAWAVQGSGSDPAGSLLVPLWRNLRTRYASDAVSHDRLRFSSVRCSRFFRWLAARLGMSCAIYLDFSRGP